MQLLMENVLAPVFEKAADQQDRLALENIWAWSLKHGQAFARYWDYLRQAGHVEDGFEPRWYSELEVQQLKDKEECGCRAVV
jgi:hypothetical protein